MFRTARAIVTAAALTAGLLAGGLTSATAAAAAEPGLTYYGANLHTLWSSNTSANVQTELHLLESTRATSGRLDVAWSSLQVNGRGTISSSYRDRIDAVVAGAHARGISLVLTLHETPCWASSAPAELKLGCEGAYWDRGVTRYPPSSYADFAWAASWIAERYAGRIAALELWNEPNYDVGHTNLTTADKPGVYTAMVKAAYPAVKAVAPGLPVLAGATAFADDVFLKGLYANGIRGFYDGISVHPYNEWRAPGAAHDPAWYKYDFVLGLEAIRRAMTAAGDSSPVWVTEVGWTNCTVGASRWCVSAEQQAAYSAAVVSLTAERFPWVKALILYNLRDKGTDISYTEDNFGLVRRDYTPKPALQAVTSAFTRLRTASQPAAADLAVSTGTEPTASSLTTTAPSATTTVTSTKKRYLPPAQRARR